MDSAVKALYSHFRERERQLLSEGSFAHRETSLGFWAGSHLPAVGSLFKAINLKKYRSFVDLGSGDGRVVLLASLFGVPSVGIEIDSALIGESLVAKNFIGHEAFEQAGFKEEDFRNVDIGNFDIVYVSPDQPFYRGLEEKFLKELKGYAIVHSWEFHPSKLKLQKEFTFHGEKFGVYAK